MNRIVYELYLKTVVENEVGKFRKQGSQLRAEKSQKIWINGLSLHDFHGRKGMKNMNQWLIRTWFVFAFEVHLEGHTQISLAHHFLLPSPSLGHLCEKRRETSYSSYWGRYKLVTGNAIDWCCRLWSWSIRS